MIKKTASSTIKIGIISLILFLTLSASTAAAVVPPSVSTSSVSGITNNSAVLTGNLDNLGSASSVNVRFEYGRTTSYGNTTPVQTLSAAGGFNATLSGLSSGSTYHFRAKADGGTYGTAYGSDMTFTTWTPPAVGTLSATNITSSSATLNGNLTYIGTAASVNVYFVYGTTAAYGNNTSAQVLATAGYFSINISGLSPGTTYHFQAKADGGMNGISSGADVTVFTTAIPPTVSSQTPTTISYTSATMRGNLLYLGNATTVTAYFEYGTTIAYGSATGGQSLTTTGPYSFNATNLQPGTAYHYRAKVDAGIYGKATGEDETFTTLAGQPPQLGFVTVNTITNTSAILVGNLSSLGTASSISVYFEYGTSTAYGTTAAASTPSGTGYNQGGFSATVTGLSRGTLYHFHAVVDAGAYGKYYSDDTTFTTTGTGATPVPAVSTEDPDSITAVSAVLNGSVDSLGSANSVYVYFEYGTSTSYGTATPRQSVNQTGPFSAGITGLKAGTLYHYHAVVDDGVLNKDYGADRTFSTSTLPPSVSTFPAEKITSSSAALQGSLDSLGTANAVNVYFEYGVSTNYGYSIGLQTLTAPTESGNFITVDLPALSPKTTYHFRIKADGGVNGVVTGKDETFTTKPVAAITIDSGSLTVTPTEIAAGQNVTVSVNVTNPSDVEGSYKVSLTVNGSAEDSQQVTVPAASGKLVSFTLARNTPGIYQVGVNGLVASFTVTPGAPTTSTGPAGNATTSAKTSTVSNSQLFIIIVLVVIVVVGAALFLIRFLEKRRT